MELTADTLYGFTASLLSKGFDNAQPTPDFHKELWDLFLQDHPYIAAAAPRGHAKSTAITHAYGLASVLFRKANFVMIVSNTEGQSVQFLHDIKNELRENEALRELFGIDKFLKETETEIVVRTKDRHQFKMVAKGSGQKVRGTKWLGKRPDLVICDDLEDDEIVMNQDRRNKFKEWFYSALLPALSDRGKVRMVGTILHLDSLLEGLLNDDTWLSRRYAAHNEDYSDILWPEKFPKERLQLIYKGYANQGVPEKYYQEYLNVPIDPHNAYFKETDFVEMSDEDIDKPKNYYAAADFAISASSRADRTVICVGGVDSDNTLHIEYVTLGRWDAKQIVDEMLSVQRRFDIDIFSAESGMIEKAIGPYLNDAMFDTGTFINLNKVVPTKDKETRARAIQARMRAGAVKFDKEAPWYDELHDEMLTFPRGKHDDIVDAMAWLGHTCDKFARAPTAEELEDEQWEEEFEDIIYDQVGMSAYTGY